MRLIEEGIAGSWRVQDEDSPVSAFSKCVEKVDVWKGRKAKQGIVKKARSINSCSGGGEGRHVEC